MNLTKEMKQRLIERIIFQKKIEELLRVCPKMELTITNGKSIGSFDLRSLNKEIVNNKKLTNS